ncbi:MAG: DEAD/DEAH box helicase [Deltaproteobacteria bacterium]|nr:DEAD/DEAH box helicase [Deltaproteobacteria bacterium]
MRTSSTQISGEMVCGRCLISDFMMIEKELKSTKSLPSTYQTLSPFEKSLLHLISIIYEPVNRITLVNCVRRAGITGPGEGWLTAAAINPFIKKLQDLELLDKDCRCPDVLVELVSRDASAAGNYREMAEVVQAEIPFSQYQSKWPQRCLRAMREYRIGLYSADMVHLENMHLILEKQCRDETVRSFPAVRFCNNPFDPGWLSHLAPSLQFYLLSQMMNYSLHYLTLLESGFSYLENREAMHAIPAEERLPFQRLLTTFLLWRGNLDAVDKIIGENHESFVASGMEGCIAFMEGNNDQALKLFEADLQQLKKISTRKRMFFPGISGLFFILALLKAGDIKNFSRIRKFIETVRMQQSGNLLIGAYEIVDHFLSAQESGTVEIPLDLSVPDSNSITVLIGAMVSYWLNGYLPTIAPREESIEPFRLLWQRARESGFLWIAMEFAELIGRVEQDAQLLHYAAEVREKTHMVSVIDAVELEEPWKRRLKALTNIASDTGPLLEKSAGNHRMVWLVGYEDGLVSIAAREQRLGADNCWSKGRPIAFSRLYSGRKLDFMTDFDRRICKTLKREQTSQKVSYRFDLKQTLPAMVGHPMLFLEESPDISVEFVKGEPELLVEKSKDELHIKLLNDFSRAGVSVIRETPTRFKIIEVTSKHKDIAKIISRSGLRVPEAYSEQVMTAVGNLSSYMTVHSAIAVDTKTINVLNGKADLIKEVTASTQVYIQLIPFGIGFKLAMFVKPFGSKGPYLKPGQGAENVMAEVDGQRLQTKRDLKQEEEKAREIVGACPTLAEYEGTGREWLLQETETCLNALLELQGCIDKIIIEWPEGKRISVRQSVSADNLVLKIGRIKGSRGLSWFAVSGALDVDESLVIDMWRLVELARRNPGRFLPLGNGEFLALTEDLRLRLDDLSYMTDLPARQEAVDHSIRIHPLTAMALAQAVQDVGCLEADEAWMEQLQLISEAQSLEPEVPSTLQADLRDYQVEGYKWLYRLAHWGGGACLADDMGLGKTLQALAIILEKTRYGPTLVVAPTSVCMNWLHEANRFAPTLQMHFWGTRNRKKLVQSLKEFDVLVTSYTLLQQEAKLLAGIDWQIIVLDEAQAIKNMETKRSRAAMSLNGRFKLLTTGTPIENHLGELWNLFNFIIPGLLGSLENFNQRFAIPIERYGDQTARRKLKKLIRPFILRRTKTQVLEELPPRTEITLQVEMNDVEYAFYEVMRRQALENLAADNNQRPQKRNTPLKVSASGNNGKGYTVRILAEIMKLRRACCNPKLVLPETDIESSKLLLFEKVVNELLENRHKALVFSQFVGHLQIIRAFLDKKKIRYRYLDGATPMKKREKEVAAFQAGQGDLFLISLKAGGLGLNLTAADYVIHMDPWWNPAVEDQASDRAHRIGQIHPVTIYRLITKHTIEEKIVKLHQEKRDLANSLLAETDISSRISVEELLNLIREQ